MITESALREAIAEVQGKRDPNRTDCMMLAAFYTIQDHLYPERGYSTAEPPETVTRGDMIGDYGDSDFLRAIRDKDPTQVWTLVDDLVETVRLLQPRVYNGLMNALDGMQPGMQ